MKTRADQYREFNSMVSHLILYCENREIPIRLGEAHRPWWVALIYAKVVLQIAINKLLGQKALPEKINGIVTSKHIKSLAIDVWVIDAQTGKKIFYNGPLLEKIGKFWESIGGIWGGRFKKADQPHFEYGEKPL